MKLFEGLENTCDLRFTHDREIVRGIRNRPDNSILLYIGNYPNIEIVNKVDIYCKELKPPNRFWDDVLNTGNSKSKGSGYVSTGFKSKYLEYLANTDEAYRMAQKIKAKSKVRPIYIGHHTKTPMYSPARVCINFIKDYVELPVERDEGTGIPEYDSV